MSLCLLHIRHDSPLPDSFRALLVQSCSLTEPRDKQVLFKQSVYSLKFTNEFSDGLFTE